MTIKYLAILISGVLFSGPAFSQGGTLPPVQMIVGAAPLSTSNPMPTREVVTDPQTYGAAVIDLANTEASDIYCITGSATKTIKVHKINVSAIATTPIIQDVYIVLRSTLDTGGGLSSVSVIKMDQNNNAATAVVNSFTSAPTAGTSIGTVRSRKLAVGDQGQTRASDLAQFVFDNPIVLRGAAQAACVHVESFGSGSSFDVDHQHTEE